jgi:chromate transporter
MTVSTSTHAVTFAEATRLWARVGLLSFGGPAGQIALMHRLLVDERRWISERRFLHALNYCMLLPGPEAQQLATYCGWLLHGWRGGLVAGTLFVLPGFLAILVLSVVFALYQEVPLISGVFLGLKAATLAVVVEAVVRIGRRVLKNRTMVAIAVLAFVAIFGFELSFPLVVIVAGLAGLIGGRLWPGQFAVITGPKASGDEGAFAISDAEAARVPPTWGRAVRVTAVGLTLWFVPIVLLAAWLGRQHVLVVQAEFFSKAAIVTFGGAYAVLAYMAQQAVEVYGWLEPGEMLNGLAMAETTPGPLIQVVQFVGFMGAFRSPAPFTPLMAGVLASVVTTWVTFVPCFLWIFLGAPSVERLRGNVVLSAGLSAITAAVVGVILNLAVWFGIHVAFGQVDERTLFGLRVFVPTLATADPAAITIALGAFIAIFRYKQGLITVLALAALAGAVLDLF